MRAILAGAMPLFQSKFLSARGAGFSPSTGCVDVSLIQCMGSNKDIGYTFSVMLRRMPKSRIVIGVLSACFIVVLLPLVFRWAQ
jgi:hypothetical protein